MCLRWRVGRFGEVGDVVLEWWWAWDLLRWRWWEDEECVCEREWEWEWSWEWEEDLAIEEEVVRLWREV